MAFWSKKTTRPESPSENPFRALNPEAFDRGAKISELRQVATSTQLTASDIIAALQIALGGEIAANVLRRNPSFSPDQKLYTIDQLLDGVSPGVREAGLYGSRSASATTES
jgi:hypothetical protein